MAKPEIPLYHITNNPALPSRLLPKHPDSTGGKGVKWGKKQMDPFNRGPDEVYLERLPARVCFAPTLEGCFVGIWTAHKKHFFEYNYPFLELFVYQLTEYEDGKMNTDKDIHERREVWDAVFSQEHYVTGWCNVKRIAKIRVYKPTASEWVKVYPFLDERYEPKDIPKPRIEIVTSYSPEAKKIQVYTKR